MAPALASVGASSQVNYVEEVTYGVTPLTPSMKIVRAKLGSKFELKRDTFSSKEMNASRQVMGLTYGNRSGSGDIPFEFSYGSFDDFLSAVMGGTQSWGGGNVLKIGNNKRSFSIEQQYPDINVNEINTGVVFTGLSLNVKPNAIVEGSFTHQFKDQASVQTPYNATATGNMTFTATTIVRASGSFLTDGFAAAGGDSVVTLGATNAVNNKTAVTLSATATVLTFAAATYTIDATNNTGLVVAKTLGTATAINTNAVFDSFTGSLTEGGVACAIVTGIDLKIDQSANASNVLFDATVQQVSLGTVNVTGTLVVRFINNALKAKFLAGTTSDIMFILGGASKKYQFDMSGVKYTSASTDSAETELSQTLAFTAIYDATDLSSLIITRTP